MISSIKSNAREQKVVKLADDSPTAARHKGKRNGSKGCRQYRGGRRCAGTCFPIRRDVYTRCDIARYHGIVANDHVVSNGQVTLYEHVVPNGNIAANDYTIADNIIGAYNNVGTLRKAALLVASD